MAEFVCGACSAVSSNEASRYMRIDNLIFDKKYVSKLVFDGDTLYLYRKGDCNRYSYKMNGEKSSLQISQYLLELNNCEVPIEMGTEDYDNVESLPDASLYKYRIVYVKPQTQEGVVITPGFLVFSDGTNWKKISLTDI